jgi:hypothetical protein
MCWAFCATILGLKQEGGRLLAARQQESVYGKHYTNQHQSVFDTGTIPPPPVAFIWLFVPVAFRMFLQMVTKNPRDRFCRQATNFDFKILQYFGLKAVNGGPVHGVAKSRS